MPFLRRFLFCPEERMEKKKSHKHGGNGKTAQEAERMQEAFAEKAVEGALAGRPIGEAIEAAGYSPTVRPAQMLRPESASREKLDKALQSRGINEDWYVEKVKLCAEKLEQGDEAFAKGGMAYVQMLKHVGHLLGHGAKPSPAVAVQINNSAPAASGVVDAGTVARLAELVGEELSRRQSGEVSGGAAGDTGVSASEGVVSSGGGGA